MKRPLCIALVSLACAFPARAEEPVQLLNRPIAEVSIEAGAESMSLLKQIGIPAGAPLTRSLLRGVVLRLLRTGRWSDVQIDAQPARKGVRLVIRLTPRFLVERVEIEGNSALDRKQIAGAIEVDTGSRVSHQDLYLLADAVRRGYAARGYLAARVQVGLKGTAQEARKVVVVSIVEGAPTRIKRIEFREGRPPDATFALSAIGLGVGDVLDRRALFEGVKRYQQRMRERGYLEAELGSPLISIDRGGAKVVVPCSIGPRYRLIIRGCEPLERSAVREALGLDQQSLFASGAREIMVKQVTDLYARNGYPAASVSIEPTAGPKPGRASLLVSIDTGVQQKVVSVTFPGARHYERSFLVGELFGYLEEDLPGSTFVSTVDNKTVDDLSQGEEGRARRGVPPPPETDPRRIYYQSTYLEAIKHIAELYQADGFLSAAVGPMQIERIDRNRIAISIPVVEGARTLLHGVVLEGNRVLGARELLAATGLERDMAFGYLHMEEARLRLVRHYREQGHLFAKVEPSVRFSQDSTRAELTIRIDEGFPVYVDEVVIRGAAHTSESLIRSLSLLEPGNLYRPSLARETEDRLLSLGVFSGVKVAPEDPELASPVKRVLIMVTERPLQLLDFSTGISTGQGLRTGFEYGYRNLFGQAVGASLRIQVAYRLFLLTEEEVWKRFEENLTTFDQQLERRATLTTIIPHIPGLTGLRTTVDLVYLRDIERDFVLDTAGVALTFGYPLARRLVMTVGGDLENNYVNLFESEDLNDYLSLLGTDPDAPRLRRLLRVPGGDSTLVSGHTSLTYDQRDNPFATTRGYALSARADLARTLESAEIETEPFVSRFVKATISASGYLPLGRAVVLAGQMRLGSIFHLSSSSQTYPNRAFFLGGVDTIRGYFQDSMMPQDKADEIERRHLDPNSVVRSGDAFVLLRGELRFPLVGKLNGGLFADLGNLWADPYGRLDPSREIDFFHLRPSAGAGLRLATPVGPLALDYGILLDRRKDLDEPFGVLHFSIGLF